MFSFRPPTSTKPFFFFFFGRRRPASPRLSNTTNGERLGLAFGQDVRYYFLSNIITHSCTDYVTDYSLPVTIAGKGAPRQSPGSTKSKPSRKTHTTEDLFAAAMPAGLLGYPQDKKYRRYRRSTSLPRSPPETQRRPSIPGNSY